MFLEETVVKRYVIPGLSISSLFWRHSRPLTLPPDLTDGDLAQELAFEVLQRPDREERVDVLALDVLPVRPLDFADKDVIGRAHESALIMDFGCVFGDPHAVKVGATKIAVELPNGLAT
ncbi:hypothetical protein ABQE45_18025 [Mycobacteroides chelonae]